MGTVSPELKKQLLALKKTDCTVEFILSKVSKTTKIERDENGKRRGFNVKEPEWDLQAPMKLKAGEYINTTDVDTTLGSFLFNKICIEGTLEPSIPGHYFNEVVTKKSIGKLINKVIPDLMSKKLPLMPNMTDFIRDFRFYGLMLCAGLSPSLTPGVFSVQKEIREERERMYAEAGGTPDLARAVEIEDKLIADAKKLLQDDPGMSLFDSGSRGSFDDNYKMMCLTVGPIPNPGTGGYDIVKNNYIDGIDKGELPAMGNSIVSGVYPKSVGTADGGYITKQFYAVFQGITMDEPGTDCGSKGYLTVFLTPANYGDYMWQYAQVGQKLVLLDPENQAMFMNRMVKLRSPIGCLSPKFCNICMGERFYKLGIRNAGLTAGRVPNSILNAGMKAFHETKVHFNKVDPEKLLI